MSDNEKLISDYSDLINEQRVWLNTFGKIRLKKWEKLFRTQTEAAICEASTRKFLHGHNVEVRPNEDISSGGVDYLCVKDNKQFYVEVTCITKYAMRRATGLPDEPEGSGNYSSSSPTTRVFREIVKKTQQCKNLDAPCIVVVCTMHHWGGMLVTSDIEIQKLLTGELLIGATLDPDSKRFKNLQWISKLCGSLFARFVKTKEQKIEEARKTISAVLVLAISAKDSWSAKGMLHPDPCRSFDRNLLPDIKFCRLADGYQAGQFEVEWI